MLKLKASPNENTYKTLGILLKRGGIPREGVEQLDVARKSGLPHGIQALRMTIFYAVGMHAEALEACDELRASGLDFDVSSYNAVIYALGSAGRINEAYKMVMIMHAKDSLKFTSALSVALAVVFVVITAGIVIVKLFSGTVKAPRLLPDIVDFTSFLKLFTVVPVIVTAYICHYNVHSICNELEDPSEMQPIVRTSLAACSIVYISTSFFGFLLFGDQTMDDVLANFDTNLGVPYSVVLNEIVRVTYVVHLMLVFPLIFFALGLNLDGLVFPAKRHLVLDNKRFILITVGLIGIIFLGASFIPSIWDAFQFTGATAAVFIGLIFPAPVALRDTHGISTRKEIFIALFMIFLAVVSSSIAIVSDINSLFNKEEEGPPRS